MSKEEKKRGHHRILEWSTRKFIRNKKFSNESKTGREKHVVTCTAENMPNYWIRRSTHSYHQQFQWQGIKETSYLLNIFNDTLHTAEKIFCHTISIGILPFWSTQCCLWCFIYCSNPQTKQTKALVKEFSLNLPWFKIPLCDSLANAFWNIREFSSLHVYGLCI